MGEKRIPSGEIEEIARELSRHMRWALDLGERELPHPAPQEAAHTPPPEAVPTPISERAASPHVPESAPPPTARVHALAAVRGSLDMGTGSEALLDLRSQIGDCRRCRLCEDRSEIVFGTGNPKARLLFVGDVPGGEEDESAIPFTGPAGQLLTKMIEAMGLRREDVYLCTVVKCRPPRDRKPSQDEVEACEPFLRSQIRAIQPEVIVALGAFAAQALLRDSTPITRLRGVWRKTEGIDLLPTFHPAYLLRSPGAKGKVWADLQLVMQRLGLAPPRR